MSPGANLSHAARCTLEAQRSLLVACIHLESADTGIMDLDDRLTLVGIGDDDLANALEDLGRIADGLQNLADTYGHAEVARLAALAQPRGAVACAM